VSAFMLITSRAFRSSQNNGSHNMNSPSFRSRSPNKFARVVAAIAWLALVLAASREALAQTPAEDQSAATTTASDTATEPETKVPEAELDSLVAPIALYPDPLLSQTLVASTYPVELMQLQQWMGKNTSLKDQALADAVAKQPWDASIQGLATFPDVVEMLAGNIQWTSDLGNAFLAQQPDVMAAVQRMRVKAQGTGTLKTTEQQKVETQTTDSGQQAIVIEPADPSVVYVPSYDPAVVYGASTYPYPTVSYPGYVAGRGLAFGTGLALGAAWGGGWGYGCGWNNGDVNVNYNNNYVKNSNKNVNQSNKNWQHNPQHRGNAPYGNKQTASKYGGTAKGQAAGTGARAGGGAAGQGAGARSGTASAGGQGARPGGGAAGAAGGGGAGARDGSAGGKAGGGGGAKTKPASKPSGGGAAAKSASSGGKAKSASKPASKQGGGGANSVGGRQPSKGGGGGGAFSGGSGSSAKAASSRGGSSMKGGGGKKGGGGGRR